MDNSKLEAAIASALDSSPDDLIEADHVVINEEPIEINGVLGEQS